jgi:type I restriction enzyme S subunit
MQTVITQYKDLTRWDIKNYLWLFRSSFSVEPLGNYIYEHSEKEKIGDQADKEFPILGVTNKIGVYLNEYVKSEKINQPYKKVKGGELTYNPYRVNVGSVGIVQDEYDNFYISPAYVVFGTKEGLLNEYIYLVLSSSWFNPYLRAATSGSVRQNLTFDLLSELNVPIPPLAIQKKIVEQWHKAKKQAEELSKKAQEQEKGIDTEMSQKLGISIQNNKNRKGIFCINFSILERWDVSYNAKELLTSGKAKYDWIKLKTYCENAQYGFTGSAVGADTGTKFLRITDLDYSGSYSEDSLPFVKIPENSKQKYLLSEDDFVFARTGATAGKCAIIKKHKQDVVFASYLIRFKFTDDIYLPFLEQYLNQGPGKRIISEIVYSSGQPNINANEIQEIKIPLPPLPKQKEIAEKVEKMRAEIQEMKNTADETLEQAKNKIGAMLKV